METRYNQWLRTRRFALPDEEERQLKRQLARSQQRCNENNRHVSAASKVGDIDSAQRQHVPSINSYFISSIDAPNKCFERLPLSVRLVVLDFVPVVEDAFAQDLDAMLSVLEGDDSTLLNASTTIPEAREDLCPSHSSSPTVATLSRSVGDMRAPRLQHPCLEIIAAIEKEVRVLYEQQIFGEFSQFAALVGVRVCGGMPAHHASNASSPPSVPRGVGSPSSSFRVGATLPIGSGDEDVDKSNQIFSGARPPPAASSVAPVLGTYGLRAGSVASSVSRTHTTTSFFQRDWFADKIRRVREQCQVKRSLIERILSWVAFRDKTLNTPCTALRPTLREDLATWEEVLNQWKVGPRPGAAPEEILFVLALDELRCYQRRVASVEYLGKELSLDDIRNLFWEVNLPRMTEDVVSADYARSITFRQAMTLGLTDIPWVSGYTWEERAAPEDEEEDGGAGTDAASVAMAPSMVGQTRSQMAAAKSGSNGAASPARTGARSMLSFARSERVQQLLGVLGIDDTLKRQMDELEAERAQLEQVAEEQRKRAFTVAADGMSQRLWLSTETFRPRTSHRFRGCEMCNETPIVFVGLHRENSAVCTDIVLCDRCFNDLYGEDGSITNRMYSWYRVADLIGSNATALS